MIIKFNILIEKKLIFESVYQRIEQLKHDVKRNPNKDNVDFLNQIEKELAILWKEYDVVCNDILFEDKISSFLNKINMKIEKINMDIYISKYHLAS